MRTLNHWKDVRLTTLNRPYHFESPFDGAEFVLVLHSDEDSVADEDMDRFADAAVAAGCRYFCATGRDRGRWHDATDCAYLRSCRDMLNPSEPLVMTTDHEDKLECMFYAFSCTYIDDFEGERLVFVLLGSSAETIKWFIEKIETHAYNDFNYEESD